MPDSWIDREELASLAGELSRKKRRSPQLGTSGRPARKRARAQSEPGEPAVVSESPAAPRPPSEAPAARARRRKLAPVAEEPLVEEPVAEEPIVEEPVAEEPLVEEPVAEEPLVEEPVAEKPLVEEPVAEEPVAAAAEPVATSERSTPPLDERDPAAEGTLTNLTIDEIDIASARSRAPRFLLDAEHLLDELSSSDRDGEDALALRTLANARARVDSGGLLKSRAPDPDPSHASDPGESESGTGALAREPAVDDWELESFFELDPDPAADAETHEAFGAGPATESDYEDRFDHAFAAQFEVAFEPELAFELDPDLEDGFETANESWAASTNASPPVEDDTYESTEESLPRKLERLSKSFASSTGARNVCIVDEAGYPLHEENPGLRTQSRSVELAFFPDTRLIGASDLAAAQAFLSGRWHGVIRGASPCTHLFLRFDREDPLETEEMEAWSRHLVEAIY